MIAHTPLGHHIDAERLARINTTYNSDNVTVDNFPECSRDLLDILLYHQSPITRHEAAFVMQKLLEEGKGSIAYLISVIKFDTSIVAKHEAVEAMGGASLSYDIHEALRFLHKIQKP